MWKSGSPESQTSSGRAPTSYSQLVVLTTRFWWLSIAPFGRPVVPDVYIRKARSSPLTSWSGGAGAAAASAAS